MAGHPGARTVGDVHGGLLRSKVARARYLAEQLSGEDPRTVAAVSALLVAAVKFDAEPHDVARMFGLEAAASSFVRAL